MIERIPQLKNRDYEATYRENGTPCPKNTGDSYWDRNVNDELCPGTTHCDNCKLCKQQVYQTNSKESCGVMCMYRKEPPFEPLYKVGDEMWYLWTYSCPQKKKIRKVEWSILDGCWRYTFSREQHSFEESHVFKTRKEADEYVLLYRVSGVLHDIQVHQKHYGSLPGSLNNLLLTTGEK